MDRRERARRPTPEIRHYRIRHEPEAVRALGRWARHMKHYGHEVSVEVDDDGIRLVTVEHAPGVVSEELPAACLAALIDGPAPDEWANEDTNPGTVPP